MTIPAVAGRIQHAGRKPVDEAGVSSLREFADRAESGEVTAFVVVGAGPDVASFDIRTGMTRQDRLTIMGELQQQLHILSQIELDQRREEGAE